VFAIYSVPFLMRDAFQNRAKTKKRLMRLRFLVGVAGFEPATPSSRTRCHARRHVSHSCLGTRLGGVSGGNETQGVAHLMVRWCAPMLAAPTGEYRPAPGCERL
jgi:hypothetical protein